LDVDQNALFDELVLVQNITPLLSSKMSVEERWVKVSNSVNKTKLTNIFQIISFVLGIPARVSEQFLNGTSAQNRPFQCHYMVLM